MITIAQIFHRNPLRFRLGMGVLLNMLLTLPLAVASENGVPWQAPPETRKVKNHVPTTGEGLTATAPVYEKNCVRCHGVAGAADGTQAKSLDPLPAKLNDANLLKHETDGELFWKISNGRDPMPGYGQLNEKERWELVNYVRDLTRRSRYRYLGSRHPR
jgi:mono/diheme cytochrome c family protein